ncbi:MAG: lactate racemase domain-containing protein, partial [Chloroflexota bacterium]|nr:lactate racemase domain-containing protein [Chloroflexota bacterium]
MTIGKGYQDRNLSEHEIRDVMEEGLETLDIEGEKVLIIIPDLTRTAPIPLFFRIFYELIGEEAEVLDYLVALGTHPIMSEKALNRRVGITAEERRGKYAGVRIFNHRWDLPDTFVTLGTIPAAEVEELSEGRLSLDVPVRLNRLILDYDQLIIVGPVFPHEVVGFSGGNKYFLPGICGQEVIDATHWLGALMTSMAIIGTKDTPVRRMIDRAASFIDQPKACFSMVVEDEGLAGLYFGSPEEAWSAAADLSSELHIRYLDHPVEKVLSVLPEMYDDMWTGGKGMYKVEPVVADGGEVIIYAPHVTEVSYTWG